MELLEHFKNVTYNYETDDDVFIARGLHLNLMVDKIGEVVTLVNDRLPEGATNLASLDLTGTLTVDTINEHTTNNGVDIEGVHLEDSVITSLTTITATNINGTTIDGDTITGDEISASTSISTDLIQEYTSGNGVSIDTVEIKDGGITLASGATVNNIETTITDDDTHIPTSGAVVDFAVEKGLSAANYIGIWSDGNTLEGSTNLQFDTSTDELTLTGDIVMSGNILRDSEIATRNIGTLGEKFSAVYTEELYLSTGDLVDTITDVIGSGNSSELATTKAVYDFAGTTVNTINTLDSAAIIDNVYIGASTTETDIHSDSNITNTIYIEEDTYVVNIVGLAVAVGVAGTVTFKVYKGDSSTGQELASIVTPSTSTGNTMHFDAKIIFGAQSSTGTRASGTMITDSTVTDTNSDTHTGYIDTDELTSSVSHGSANGITVTATASTDDSDFEVEIHFVTLKRLRNNS